MKSIVYIITDGTYYKIGITSRLDKRIKMLQVGHPTKLTVVHKSEDMSRASAFYVEKLAHAQLVAHRLHGEWFDVPLSKAIKAVESINFQNEIIQAISVPTLTGTRPSISERIIQQMNGHA